MKKQLIINTLSFEVHTEVYDGYGDMELADRRFTIDRKSRVLTMTDFHTGGVEQSVTLEGGQMAKLLRYIVHTLEIFMWEQDYSLRPDEEDYDPFLDGEEDFFMEDLGDGLEVVVRQIKRGCFRQIKTVRQEASGKHPVTLLSVYSAHWKKQQTTHAD